MARWQHGLVVAGGTAQRPRPRPPPPPVIPAAEAPHQHQPTATTASRVGAPRWNATLPGTPAAPVIVTTAAQLQQALEANAVDIEIRSHLDLRGLERKQNPLVVPCMARGINEDLLLEDWTAGRDGSAPSPSKAEPHAFKSHLVYVSSSTRSIRVRTCGHLMHHTSLPTHWPVHEPCHSERRLHPRTASHRETMETDSSGC